MTVQYGVGGHVKVKKPQVYTKKKYEAEAGTTKKVETTLTGSASGRKDAQINLTYKSQGGEYQGLVVSKGKAASGGSELNYQRKESDGEILTGNLINGSSEDTGENAECHNQLCKCQPRPRW